MLIIRIYVMYIIKLHFSRLSVLSCFAPLSDWSNLSTEVQDRVQVVPYMPVGPWPEWCVEECKVTKQVDICVQHFHQSMCTCPTLFFTHCDSFTCYYVIVANLHYRKRIFSSIIHACQIRIFLLKQCEIYMARYFLKIERKLTVVYVKSSIDVSSIIRKHMYARKKFHLHGILFKYWRGQDSSVTSLLWIFNKLLFFCLISAKHFHWNVTEITILIWKYYISHCQRQ